MTECDIIRKYEILQAKVKPFEDEYFEGLTYEQIAELAKKSIRLTTYNRGLIEKIEEIDKKLELALDAEQTDAKESFDLLYEIQDIISEAIGE